MNRSKKTLFISDIHLEQNGLKGQQQFLKLLQVLDKNQIDALYILGDLFETWIGDDDDTEFNSTIIKGLTQIRAKGIPLFFIHGNRDFLIGETFLRQTGCELLPDHTLVPLYGQSVLIMHGDTLCTCDSHYLRLRKISRNKLIQWLYLALPLQWRRGIANYLRKKSNKYTSQTPSSMMDVSEKEVEKIMQNYKAETLIHGHTHRPYIHEVQVGDHLARRIVLGAWHKKGNVLVCDEGGAMRLIDFDVDDDFRFLRE